MSQERPGISGWWAVALVLITAMLALLALLGTLSTGTSLGLMALTFGSFVLCVGSLFSDDQNVEHRHR